MTLAEALHHVIDAARQHRDTLEETGRLEGVAALLSEAIKVVEISPLEAVVASESQAMAERREALVRLRSAL